MKIINFTLFFILILFSNTQASHILGGSISYHRISGTNQYQITAEIYKNCTSGGNVASFDNPATFTIYDGQNNLHSNHSVSLQGSDTVSIDSIPLCPTVLPCVEIGYYAFTVTLPYHVDGYDITYERCCRSSLITNIPNPSSIGMSITTHLSGTAMINGNNSPSFNQQVPSVLYVSASQVAYDASAIDIDGDSLVYKLITPYHGGTITNPMPTQAAPPPYTNIPFLSPYTLNDMIGGTTPLSIDSITGIITASPNTIGSFLVSYAVEEYRNNTLLSTTRREFMLLVINGGFDKNIAGTIFVDNSIPIDTGIVTLLQENPIIDSIFVQAVQHTDTSARYDFNNIHGGLFYLKAAPDSTSIFSTSHLPTYYGNSLFWNTASIVDLCTTSLDSVDIQLQPLIPFSGNNAIRGTIVLEDNSLPVSGLTLLLLNAQEEAVGYTTTDAQGYFEFQQLGIDSFQLYIDLINSTILNKYPVAFSFSSNFQIWEAALEMQTDRLSITNLVATNEFSTTPSIQLFPNPSNADFYLQTSFSEENVLVEIYSIHGQKVYSKVLNVIENESQKIKFNSPTGVYFVKIQGKKQQVVKKLLIQK